MYNLNLPKYNLSTKLINDKKYVFEVIRKKYVVLTPEEFVRQNFVQFLIQEKKYPASLVATEILLKINNLSKRADIVLYNRVGEASLIVECKAPEVKITQKAFDQILRYNISLRADYLIITNGIKHYCCKHDFENNSCVFLADIPHYDTIK